VPGIIVYRQLEKIRIIFVLENINDFRVDAHAKSIADKDFQQLRLGVEKLRRSSMNGN
jgi:hypothetical protein